jgi:uncharacterized membrane-anchored protein YjiN (DUF445 family)
MKNKRKADIILGLLILIFIFMAVLKHYYGEPLILRMLIYVVEAALVGSIADWFAVTVLFKKPLGLPMKPIIPTNKDKILNSLSTVVNNNLLNMNYIQATIKDIPISKILVSTIENTDIVSKTRNQIAAYALNYLKKLKNDEDRSAKVVHFIHKMTKDINLIKTKALDIVIELIESRFSKHLYSSLIGKCIDFAASDIAYTNIRNLFVNYFNSQSKLINSLADTDDLTRATQLECIDFLKEIQFSNDNYLSVKKWVHNFTEDRLQKSDIRKVLLDFSADFITEERLDMIINGLENLLAFISDGNKSTSRMVSTDSNLQAVLNIITDLTNDLWEEIKNAPETLEWIDSVSKDLLIEIISKNRLELSNFIEERIKAFTDAELTNLIENSAGEPLHWIRINGALLGSILGLILFSFINFLYEPYIIPLAYKMIDLL